MNILLTALSTLTLLSGAILPTISNTNQQSYNEKSLPELIHINEEKKSKHLDAGTTWIWSTSSDYDYTMTNEHTINLQEYGNNDWTFFHNLKFVFDLNGSAVDVDDQNKKWNSKGDNIVYYAEIKDKSSDKWNSYLLGDKPKSGKGADYITASFYAVIKLDTETKTLHYFTEMDSYAFNGGNGAANTHGKGTNFLNFNSIEMKHDKE